METRKLYCGIDLHSNNSFIVLIEENDNRLIEKKLPNDLGRVLDLLKPYQREIIGVVIESTFNWYWLVDGLIDNGFKVHLANPAAIVQYSGLKHTDDRYDSFWLAHLLRLGILHEGYICPRELRGVRDLARKRSQLVRYRTAQILSMQNMISRNTGCGLSCQKIKTLSEESLKEIILDDNCYLATLSNLRIMRALDVEIHEIEHAIFSQVKLLPEFERLKTVDGIGKILALTIMLETGDIHRFKKVGNYASYCRCVSSKKTSNHKKKGEGNKKNGNKYLSWAFVEAANFFIRHNELGKRYFQKKAAKTKKVVAIKAVAHKLSRACYFMMRDQTDFDVEKLLSY